MKKTTQTMSQVPVWDGFIRLFHWGLVASISLAALSGFVLDSSWINLHIWSATSAVILLLARIVWGFSGGTYARFSSFVIRPRRILDHVKALRKGREKRYLGHNPLGGVMVLALMATIIAVAASGTVLLGGVLKSGPLAALVPYTIGNGSGEVHEALALLLLVLITAHVGGVIFEIRRHKDNLVKAMITGSKNARAQDVTAPQKTSYPMLATAITAMVLGASSLVAGMLMAIPPTRMPVAQFNPLVADECSACHMLYHPSLLPAKDWDRITATLENHFGEDASLDEQSTREIRDWLMAHAAETADTRPSHIFTLGSKTNGLPGSITDTPFWQHRHEELLEDQSIFERKGIRSKSNCVACHKDAESGLFSPFNISIPKE